ncbi:MAG: threonine synthase [Euryarchaeota archaeon]|nr:threonine synthase [Euryarchaeota archaeon]
MFAIGLECRECKEHYPKKVLNACQLCFGPVDVIYDYDKISSAISRTKIEKRKPTLWRYIELLPIDDTDKIVDIGAGFTPLLKADKLAKELGLKEVYLKNDAVNPSYSFKDRPASVAVTKALEFGMPAVGCASTGNLAGALAAHAAKAGLPCFVFVPEGLEITKITQTLAYGAIIVAVKGTYDQVNRLATELAVTSNIGFANINIRPYYVEGSKTLAFEVCEQLGWNPPDHVIVPMASGALLHSIGRGFQEFERVGLIKENHVKISGAQPNGCSPIIQALLNKTDEIIPVEHPNTICKSLAIGDPADGYYAIQTMKNTGGTGRASTDEETLGAIELLAKTEGIFTEPAGGVVVATLKKLAEEGEIDRDEKIVLYITGNGLKTQETIAEKLIKPPTIEPSFEAFKKLLDELKPAGVIWRRNSA